MAGESHIKRARTLLRRSRFDAKEVVDLLHRAARSGNAEALYALGTWHLFGVHVRMDRRAAAGYLERAASMGHPAAVYDLAVSYEKGAGVSRDRHRAFNLYMKAALLGDRDAKYEVCRCFYHGIGTARDREAAQVWLDAYQRGKQESRTVARTGIAQGWRSRIAA